MTFAPQRHMAQTSSPHPLKLMDQLRQACRLKHFSPRTEEGYCLWARRFIVFHAKRHPRELDAADVSRFLSSLATDRHVSASTQNQALSALLFLYRVVLGQPLPPLPTVERFALPPSCPSCSPALKFVLSTTPT